MTYTELNSILFISSNYSIDSLAYNFNLALEKSSKKHNDKEFSTQIISLVNETFIFVPSIYSTDSFAYKLRNKSSVWNSPNPFDIKLTHNVPDK